MMMKVDFSSIRNVGRRPARILVTLLENWVVKLFSRIKKVPLRLICKRAAQFRYFWPDFSLKHRHPIMHIKNA